VKVFTAEYACTYKVWNCDTEYHLAFVCDSPADAWECFFHTLRRAGNRIDMIQKVEFLKVVE